MSRTLRCFVGVDFPVPRKVRKIVEGLDALRPAVRPVEIENLHVTLQFLGDVEMSDVTPINEAITAACEGMTRCEAELIGVGAFPNADRPSVVWVGMDDAESIVALAERIGERLTPLGFPPERRKFTPHLTIARVKAKPAPELFRLLSKESRTSLGRVPITRAVLYQSDLSRNEAIYAPLATYRFRK